MDVGDVLRDRMQEPSGLRKMVVVSLVGHAAMFVLAVLNPGCGFSERASRPKSIMTITLGGGTPGPQNGGLTTIGGRPIQVQTPLEAPKRPEPVRAPAAATPEMTLPKAGAKPSRATPTTPIKDAPRDAKGRTPTRGSETSAGSSVAETGVRGQGFGLSTGGGAGGTGVRLDVSDFCCPDYLLTMTQRIQANWNPHAENVGEPVVKFTIQRDGTITDVQLERSSGYTALDLGAQRALAITRQLPPLPGGYTNPSLVLHLTFRYMK